MATKEQIEKLATSLARGTGNPHWVVNNNGHYYAVKKPMFAGVLALAVLKHFLAGIGVQVLTEFDDTGLRKDLTNDG